MKTPLLYFSLNDASVIMATVASLIFIFPSLVVSQDYYVKPNKDATSGNSSRQNTQNKFSISISAGPSIPLRDFGSSHVTGSFWDQHSTDSTRLQGFAKMGFHYEITANQPVTKNIGVAILVGGDVNGFNTTAFEEATSYPAIANSHFDLGEYLIGPSYIYSPNSKVSIAVKVLAGLITAPYPQLDLTFPYKEYGSFTFTSSNAFAYSFSSEVHYSAGRVIDFLVKMAYTGSVIKYPSWSATYSIPGYYPLTISHLNDQTIMTLGELELSIGIALKISR